MHVCRYMHIDNDSITNITAFPNLNSYKTAFMEEWITYNFTSLKYNLLLASVRYMVTDIL